MRHIRTGKSGGRDRRTRGYSGLNKMAPTVCGAEPSADDIGRARALTLIANHKAVGHRADSPRWLEGICPACIDRTSSH